MNISSNQFGLIVAYLLPGFIALAGIARLLPSVAAWLQPVGQGGANLGPPIYALLAATTLGMIIGAIRWVLIDHIHQWTGVLPPVWDDSRLGDSLVAFNYLVESHYRYYQFVSGALLAVIWTYAIERLTNASPLLGVGTDLGVFILCAVLFAGSRDALKKYYNRTGRLVGHVAKKDLDGNFMFNGNHHETEGGAAPKPRPEVKPVVKTDAAGKNDQSKAKLTPPAK
jgi:hypothetical protein